MVGYEVDVIKDLIKKNIESLELLVRLIDVGDGAQIVLNELKEELSL